MVNLIGKTLLSQFRIDSFAASGGMGSVYRVWDLKRNVPLAMKVLHIETAESLSAFKSFQREARALQKLAHPNIVSFYGVYQTPDFAFLLERFIDGSSLKEILRQRKGEPLQIGEALTYFKALCAALGYAHANGVVHCDVKPANVMVDREGNIYLTDFGNARHAESTTATLVAAGTPAYMAPEQILDKEVTPAADIYALGVILFEMLTGQRPFRGTEVGTEKSGQAINEQICYAHLHLLPPNPQELNPAITGDLKMVILKALAKYPQERFRTVQDFYLEACRASGLDPAKIPDRSPLKMASQQQSRSSDLSSKKNKKKKSLLSLLFTKKAVDDTERHEVDTVVRDAEDEEITAATQYDLVIPLVSWFRLSPTRETFVGRQEEMNSFVSHLMLSEGGTFLIAGYRGVGKSTFVKRSIEELGHRFNENKQQVLVDIWLNLPRAIFAKELMHLIIASLCERLANLGLIKALDRQLQADLNLALDRISAQIQEKKTDISGMAASIGINSVAKLDTSASKKGQTERITQYRDYDASLAEQNLILILQRLKGTNIAQPRRKRELKIVFIFDELDKIEDLSSLEEMLNSLKGLFTDSDASFVFVVGKAQYNHWVSEPLRIENPYDSIVSKFDLYLSPLWGKADEIFFPFFSDNGITGHLSHSVDPNGILQDFAGYLSFKGRGLPRSLWRAFGKYIFTTKRGAFLGFKRPEVRKFHFYNELQNSLVNYFDEYVTSQFDSFGLKQDTLKMSIYHLIDWALKNGEDWFTLRELLELIHSSDQSLSENLNIELITNLFATLNKREFIEIKGSQYRLSQRRLIERGKVSEDFLTDDIPLQNLATKNKRQDRETHLNHSENGETVFDLTPNNIFSEHASEPDDWILELMPIGQAIKIRPNPRATDVYEKFFSSSTEFEEKVDIGRASNNDLQLIDPTVSRYHARLLYFSDKWTIVDSNTANGTLINNVAITKVEALSAGDVISIGKLKLVFQ